MINYSISLIKSRIENSDFWILMDFWIIIWMFLMRQRIYINKRVNFLNFILIHIIDQFFSSPALSNTLMADIVNFYVKLSLQYHITFHVNQDIKQIDHLFQQFYIQHQHMIHSNELIFKNLEYLSVYFYIFRTSWNVQLLF